MYKARVLREKRAYMSQGLISYMKRHPSTKPGEFHLRKHTLRLYLLLDLEQM